MKKDTLQIILDIGLAFSGEKDKEKLLDKMLEAAMEITGCDGGTLYIRNGEELDFKIMITRSRQIHQGAGRKETTLPPVPLRKEHVCACSVLYRRLIRIDNIYDNEQYDFTGAKQYDAMTGYHTQSMMVVPLEDDKERVIGVVQLINAMDEEGRVIPFKEEQERILLSIGSQAAIGLVNMNYAQQIREMLDSYVKVMSTAIDARTPYNANHTRNMVRYAKGFIAWLKEQNRPDLLDEQKEQEFLMSIWMHDIGKLVTPIEVMDKKDRLADNYSKVMDRLERIRLLNRIRELEGKISRQEAGDYSARIRQAKELVTKVNEISYLTKDLEAEVRNISELTYQEEDGSRKPWITKQEKEQLLIEAGTLTGEERRIMQQHVEMTRIMLEQMTLGEDYANVLTWAGEHHELLDGSGYPKGLSGEQICPEVRLLTILDIFEAMTAADRPYKEPMPVEYALEKLHRMAESGQIDGRILELFEQSRAWENRA